MEGLMQRALIIGGIAALSGAYVHLTPHPDPERKTEQWMEQNLPQQFGKYHYTGSAENPQQSYRMNQETYDALRPYGIVCRKYTNGEKAFDVVVIASNSRASFHDPRLCFSVQGWNIHTEKHLTFDWGGRNIPFTSVEMDGPAGESRAMYFYKGPAGYFPDTAGLKIGMFWYSIKGGARSDGVYYRIIPEYPGATTDDIVSFAREFKDAADKSSGGYF